jgi:hypothetical protein
LLKNALPHSRATATAAFPYDRSTATVVQQTKVKADRKNEITVNRRIMNRQLIRILFATGLVAVIALCLALGFSYLPQYRTEAQTSLPSSKAALQVGNIAVMSGKLGAGSSETGWMDVMSTTIKTSQQKDLIMTASMEVSSYQGTIPGKT